MKDELTGRKIDFNIADGCDRDEYPEYEDEDMSPFDKYFAGIFMPILDDAAELYASHIPNKGESWIINSDSRHMITRFVGETGEALALIGSGQDFSSEEYSTKLRKEILDVINIALMAVKKLDVEASGLENPLENMMKVSTQPGTTKKPINPQEKLREMLWDRLVETGAVDEVIYEMIVDTVTKYKGEC